MKTTLSVFILLISTFAFSQQNKVLIIGIDGCRPDALRAANTPNIDALVANATYSWDALNNGTTVSGPSWSAMLTGVWEEKHGVNDNSFSNDNYSVYPHFFKRVEEQNSDLHTVSICQWHPINDYFAVDFADVVINTSGGSAGVDQAAAEYLTNNDPDAIFLHFDDVDGAGHTYGYSLESPNYLATIETVDESIGKVMAALNNRPNIENENWAVIVSADHGGIGQGHGGTTIDERNVFLIVSGDSIPNEKIGKDSSLTTIFPPENCLEDSVQLYFDGASVVRTEPDTVFDFGADRDFTVECRVRTYYAEDVAIVTDKDWLSGQLDGFVFSFRSGDGPWKVNVGDGTNRVDIEGGRIADEEWHTLGATFDRDGLLTIYEDGVNAGSKSMAGIGNIYSGFPVCIGADVNNKYDYIGYISEVRIFRGLVAPEAIDEWKCKKLDETHPNAADLIGYWRLTEGNGSTIAHDSSSTGANGTITGAVWENTSDTTESWEYDYINTPRIVDVAVTAMEHLCVPISNDWNLDGKIVGASCSGTPAAIKQHSLDHNESVLVYPNPSVGEVSIRVEGIINDQYTLTVCDLLGKPVQTIKIQGAEVVTLRNQEFPGGIYFYYLTSDRTQVAKGKFTIAGK